MSRSSVPPPVTRVLDAAESWLPRRMALVESRLAELVAGHGERLAEEAGATLAAGGKRLRPILVLLCAGPEAGAPAVRAATAVELVHMATLVHDDVLDAAPLRRGRPTVLARAGPAVATAVGDLLLSRAFAELGGGAREGDGGSLDDGDGAGIAADGTAAAAVSLLAGASVALARGELMQRSDAFDTGIAPERYLARCRLKTGRLFECACVIGLRPDEREAGPALSEFGREVGLAFQLLDDVLDVSGPPERTGKARGTDLLDGTVTLPLIVARERDRSLAELDLRGLDEQGAEAICERIAATGVLEDVRERARARIAAARAALEGSGLDRDRRELLGLVADGVVERYA